MSDSGGGDHGGADVPSSAPQKRVTLVELFYAGNLLLREVMKTAVANGASGLPTLGEVAIRLAFLDAGRPAFTGVCLPLSSGKARDFARRLRREGVNRSVSGGKRLRCHCRG